MFYRQLLDAARADPGVESATLAAFIPMAFLDTPARRVAIEGYEPRRAFALVLGCVSIATIIPAWRASGTNVLTALRHQ